MAVDKKSFEVDRLKNMVQAFGWIMTSQQFEGDKIIISLEKVVTQEVPLGG